MRRICLFASFLVSTGLIAQDTTTNILPVVPAQGDDGKGTPVKIFNGQRAINSNTTEMVGRGKMEFYVTHFFDDFDGDGGVITRFLGLDNARDIRIAFHIGLSDKLDLNIARVKGDGQVTRLYELGMKYQLTDQREGVSGHKLAMALFASATVASCPAKPHNSTRDSETNYSDFSDRLYKVVQLIIARKFGKVSLQLNPTLSCAGYVIPGDQKNIFALGGVVRVPISRSFNFVLDYFHPFRSEASRKYFKDTAISHSKTYMDFTDPVGVGFEIITDGHIFHLNFTNNTQILESRFIHRTFTKWGKGQFRWGFTISRTFVLKKPK